MILAFDTYYFENKARTIALEFKHWDDETPIRIHKHEKSDVKEYESGYFYKRELPCILDLLKTVDINSIDYIVIDGFVYLDDDKKMGLGGHLFNSLNGKIPIIGVAKNSFATINLMNSTLFRGESKKPLFITSIGIELELATEFIKQMHGEFRFPTLLKLVDGFSRNNL